MRRLAFLLILAGCQEYNADVCDDLGMKKYQGRPLESKEYDVNCRDKISHTYTTQMCQKALELLMLEGNREKLEQTFGAKIMNCFTGDDLKRFLK